MTVESFEPTQQVPVTLSESAKAHFVNSLAGTAKLVRVSVKKSGCSGYAYELNLVDAAEASDQILNFETVQLAVAQDAVAMLAGTEIDMVEEGINKVLKFNNPNVVAECGCGESFSVG